MVRIRLMRIGQKKQPVYRIVITDKRNARDSRYLEAIGYYNPRTQPHTVELEEGRALYWLSVGASPSESVQQLFKETGTMGRFERFRGGEDMEALVAEAEAEKEAAEPISAKTHYAAPQKSTSDEPVAELVEEDEAVEEEAVEVEEETAEEAVAEEEVAEAEAEDVEVVAEDEEAAAEEEAAEEESSEEETEAAVAEADVEDEDAEEEDSEEETEPEEA
jgi:small subunit ribosomal protein S16